MRLAFTLSTLLGLIISLLSCSQSKSDKKPTPVSATSIIDTSSIAVLVFDQRGNWPFDNSYKPTSLSDNEILEVDSLLSHCVLEYNKNLTENLRKHYSIDFKKYEYKRQYIAVVNDKGEKEVWVNGFCNAWDSKWKKEILHVDDGGNCYFNLKINLTTKKYFDVVVNGYA